MMPTHFSTPFDRDPEPVLSQKTKIRWRKLFGDMCFVTLHMSSFAITTVMIALGLPLFFFLTIAGWDLHLLSAHIDNLVEHYESADGARRLAFSAELRIGFAGSTMLVAAMRMPGFMHAISQGLETDRLEEKS